MGRKFLFLLVLSAQLLVFGKEVPEPNPGNRAFVKDVADALTEAQEIALCNKLYNYYDTTSNEFVILIEESLEDEDLFGYTLKVARQWDIGDKDKRNGLLIFVATKDRKTFIQVNEGLGGVIPDALAGRVVDQVLVPNFKSVGYYEGVDQAVDRLMEYAAGEYENDGKPNKSGFPVLIVIVIIVIALIVFSSFGDNTGTTYRNRRGGWIIGPGAGGYIGGGGGGGGFSGGGFGGFGGGGGGFSGGGAGGSW